MAQQTPTKSGAPKRTLASVVTGLLRDRILSGDFPPGTQMNEVELARYFEISRGPLREATQRLIQEGLLVSYPHRGVFVPVYTEEDLQDIFIAREALEREAMRRVTTHGVPAALVADLEVVVEQMRHAAREDDLAALAALDLAFHRRLVAGAGSTRLDRLYGLIANEMQMCLRMIVDAYTDSTDLYAEHAQLLHVIASGDAAAARSLLDRHFGQPSDVGAALAGRPVSHPLHPHPHSHQDRTQHDHADGFRHDKGDPAEEQS